MTPPSVRFLGRKVYLGVIVILISAMRQGPTPRRVRELSTRFGADRRTIARWQVFWREHFPQTPFWKIARARLVPVVEIVSLPYSLVDAFLRSPSHLQGLDAPAAVSLTDHGSRGPANRGFDDDRTPTRRRCSSPTRVSRCKEVVTVPSPYLVRRRDDSNTPQIDQRPVGALSILRGGLALELSPARGALKTAIRSLAEKTWSHPVTGRDVRFAAVTIERWYYMARRGHDDPVGVLRRAVRKDCGKVSLAVGRRRAALAPVPRPPALELPTALRQPRRLGEGRSCRWGRFAPIPRSGGTCRLTAGCAGRGSRPSGRPGEVRAETRRQTREIRSYEAAYVGSLWHLDFHHGSLKVLTSRRPVAAADRAGHPR